MALFKVSWPILAYWDLNTRNGFWIGLIQKLRKKMGLKTMETIYKTTKMKNNGLRYEITYGVYSKGLYRIELTYKGNTKLRTRIAKVMSNTKNWENLESCLSLKGDQILSEPIYLKATDSYDLTKCAKGKYHVCFKPTPSLIESIKLYYFNQIKKEMK